MGLEQVLICPENIVPYSPEYNDWYNSLSNKDSAIIWVQAELEKIEILKTITNIDVDRATRGIIVGSICGDATVGLQTANMLARNANKMQFDQDTTILNIQNSWEKITLAIEKIGNLLPPQCLTAFESILSIHGPFIENLITSQSTIDAHYLNLQTNDLLTDIDAIESEPPGMEESDIGYALNVLSRYLHPNADLEEY